MFKNPNCLDCWINHIFEINRLRVRNAIHERTEKRLLKQIAKYEKMLAIDDDIEYRENMPDDDEFNDIFPDMEDD